MSNTVDKLNKLIDTKESIRQAIINKGVSVPTSTPFADYPEKISAIESGASDDSFFNIRTNNGTNYGYLFYYCKATTLDLSSFNTSNVTDMRNMFYQCYSLTTLDLSNFDTSNVDYMNAMFSTCKALTTLDLSNFDTSNVTNTTSMFSSCNSLHTLRLDNCDNATINKIITSSGFPTGAISGVTRTIYCKEENASGLTPPTNWVFSYI